jgi:hypothetical protein
LVNGEDQKMTRKRRQLWLRGAIWAVAGLVAAVLPATPSLAHGDPNNGPWYHSTTSPCSNAISGRNGGGYGWAHHRYDAYRASTRRYVIEYSRNWADNFRQCAQDTSVSPYRITVSVQFQFDGTALSCTGGIDLSFKSAGLNASCTASGTTVTETVSATCAVNSSSCRIEIGYLEVLAPSGSSFANYVFSKTRVVVTNSTGNVVLWETPRE